MKSLSFRESLAAQVPWFFLGIVGAWAASKGGFTAWEWPALDMAPYFMRLMDPNFAVNDFFTDASLSPNPRQVFGGLVRMLSAAIGSWYGAFLLIKALLAVALPVLLWANFRQAVRLAGSVWTSGLAWSAASVIALILAADCLPLFAVAWWNPLPILAAPQSVALALGLLAPLLVSLPWLAWPVAALSCAIHPSVGLYSLAFAALLRPSWWGGKKALFWGSAFLLPAVALALVYRAQSPLSGADFVRLYAKEGHPSHYILNSFGTNTSKPWTYSFAAVLGIQMGAWALAFAFKKRAALWVAGASALAYAMAVALQWGAVSVNSKGLVALAPIRFSMFGLWLGLAAWFLLLAPNKAPEVKAAASRLSVWLGAFMLLTAVGLLFVAAPKEPWLQVRAQRPQLQAFIAGLPAGSVLAVPPTGLDLLSCVHGKALYCGNGFPFSEAFMVEHAQRDALLYGSPLEHATLSGSWVGEKRSKYYYTMGPTGLERAAAKYRLDYALVEKSQALAFRQFKPLFDSDAYQIFAVRQKGRP